MNHSGDRLQGCYSFVTLRCDILELTSMPTGALYPLYHKFDSGKKSKVTYAELRDALSPVFSVPWTHIAERLTTGKNVRLASLSAKDKASVLFLRVYK